ncbi:hypothetical protein ASZ90_004475 [hydrocarbon metagenome]|uniref:BrnT family toxin n=1 Tax=hydrocarbon metagenome TaxID=938273 RepID=A0A0W8FYC5_9ZZZZ
MEIVFEWDKNKAGNNLRKHNVDFAEAKTVFYDPLSKIFDDEFHSTDENREIMIGHSGKGRLLIVIFTERKQNLNKINQCKRRNNK